MRRNDLTILLALPVVNALSLANFQQINSVLIPLSCLLTYDSQISSCTKSDFNNGCSIACIAGLNVIAQDVSDSCAEVTVNSNTLLGIVKNGGIVAALCPTLARTTTTIVHPTTAPMALTSPAPAVSVTIPTDSQGVTGGLGFKTTTTTSVTRSSARQSSSSVPATIKSTSTSKTSTSSESSTSSTSSTTVSTASTTSAASNKNSASSARLITTTSTSKKGSIAATTSSVASKASPQPDNRSGGGSPFDVQIQGSRSSASRIGSDSIMGLVILVVACITMGR